jgi:hydrogenase-4 component E
MMPSAPPSTFTGAADVIAVLVLLTEFAMLRSTMLRSQVRLYAFQSLAVVTLAIVVAATRHVGDLYVLAGLSFLLKVVIVPGIVLRLLSRSEGDLVGRSTFGVATMTFIAIAVSIFGFFSIGALHLQSSSLPSAALAISVAVVLVAFVLIILRSDVVSQAIGFFSLENGVSVASLVVASRLPLVLDVAFLFDLLVAVVVFGVLMRVHHGRTQSLSTETLDRLKG